MREVRGDHHVLQTTGRHSPALLSLPFIRSLPHCYRIRVRDQGFTCCEDGCQGNQESDVIKGSVRSGMILIRVLLN